MTTTLRASMWSITINNPTPDDDEAINLARQRGWEVLGQTEVGEGGTRHYQIALKTPQVRFSAVKKAFPRAHIEIARDPHALLRYVSKEESREGDLPEQQNMYPSLSKFWVLVLEYLTLDKEGLDIVELANGNVKFYYDSANALFCKNPLHFLDEAVRFLIKAGYHVEGIGANPTTRSQWNLYHDSIILRSYEMKQLADMRTQQEDADETRSQSMEEI